MPNRRRVVVTGMGTVNPLGLSVNTSWQALLRGESGVVPCDFECEDLAAQIYAPVKDFNPEEHGLEAKEARRLDTFIQYGVAAAGQAMVDSGFVVSPENAARIGVAIGSGIGGLPMIADNTQELLERGPRKISPFFIPGCIINMVAGYVSIKQGVRGPNLSVVTACTSATHCIGLAARLILAGDADAMLAGGAEKASGRLCLAGFSAARALSTRNDEPTRASRPWDQDRDGFVLGDGAGVLMLEEYEHAKARGAKIYAELSGFGMSADAYHMTSPDESGAGFRLCMENALYDAKLFPKDIGYINAHGTSTPVGDVIEARAIADSFAGALDHLLVSSSKSMTGHLLGGAGAIEAIFSIMALVDQQVPPTINLEQLDPACDVGVDFVPGKSRRVALRHCLSNSFGFGGTNGTLIFSAVN